MTMADARSRPIDTYANRVRTTLRRTLQQNRDARWSPGSHRLAAAPPDRVGHSERRVPNVP